jgi:hypothetical protein
MQSLDHDAASDSVRRLQLKSIAGFDGQLANWMLSVVAEIELVL